MKRTTFISLFVLFLGAVFIWRVIHLDRRPMHHDEANQALKFGQLLETGSYYYDPREHHGPSLYYLTLPVAKIAGADSLQEVNETLLRLVPLLSAVGLMLLFLLFQGGIPSTAILLSGLLAGLSPFFSYYSCFYIQEPLLVFSLTGLIGSGWQYYRKRTIFWAVLAGIFAGLMYATKETSALLFISCAIAILALSIINKKRVPGAEIKKLAHSPAVTGFHIFVFIIAALGIAVIFYTSFLSHPGGLADSIRAFGFYLNKGTHVSDHQHPWWFYFKMLGFEKTGQGFIWSEAFIFILALAGAISSFVNKKSPDDNLKLDRFFIFFTLITALLYSAIPYKTPWNAMPFYLGFIILAGQGAYWLWRLSQAVISKAIIITLLISGFASLAIQNYRVTVLDYASPQNPYFYAQTSPDFMRLVKRIEDVSMANDGKMTLIVVACPPDETWPLPWYLRKFKQVGYWTKLEEVDLLARASLIISSIAESQKLESVASQEFISSYYELRPGILICLSVSQDAWDKYLKTRPNSIHK